MPIQSLLDVPAPAKLNLFLHVLGRRPDGYHLLQSAFVLVDWSDTLHFERRSDGLLRRHDLTAALPEDDLCLRAARSLQAASHCPLGCDISIDKQLPSGAGMGGGSSDAATTLLALNRLWGLNWPRRRLQELALPLGADVPFFVGGDNAWVEGIGERISPLALRPHRLVVVKPPCHVNTGMIFNSPGLVRSNDAAILAGFLARTVSDGVSYETLLDASVGTQAVGTQASGTKSQAAASPWPTDELFHGFGRNDLQPVVEAEFPEVAQAVQMLRGQFGNSRMTGSGSAVFSTLAGEVPNAVPNAVPSGGGEALKERKRFEETLSAQLPAQWIARMCSSLSRHPLRDWVQDL